MTAAVVNDSAANGDGGGNPNETVEAAKAGDVTVRGDDNLFDKTAAVAEANGGGQAAKKTASDHSEGANNSESDEASQIEVTKQAKVKVTTLATVKSEEVDHHGGGVAGSSKEVNGGGLKNRSQHPSGSSYHHQQQQQQSLQPQKLKAHYSQWPLPPHTYAAGRQHSAEDGASAGNGGGGGGEQSSSSKDGPSGTTDVKNASGAGSGNINNKSSSNNNDDEDDDEELLIKNDAKKKPQAIYSSNNASSSASSAPPPPSSSSAVAGGAAPGPWGSNTGHPHHPQQNPPHPLHPSHPHHPHHAQYQAHYQQWYRHYAHHHHHHQQQQRQHGQQGPPPHGQQPQQQHHAAHYHWHRQQQQQQHAHYPTQMKSSTTTSDTQQQQQHHPPSQSYHHHASTIYPTRSNDSSTNGTKRNVRELSTVDSREDTNTVRMKEENEEDSTTSCTMSLGDFSMTSLASSSPKGKRRKGTSRGRNSYDDDSLELSDKEIMNNLSMNSSYSSDMAAMLYGTSPTNSVVHRTSTTNQDDDDLGKTPKKNNTSSKKPRPWDSSNAATNGMDDAVFRLDSMTPRFRSGTSDTDDGSSPALLDLIGGAETPTTGLLMSSIENAMMDDISLNRNLRGHAFTPLPHIMGGGAGGDAALGSGGDASGLSITPQLSWSTNNGSPLEITPRCFGLLDSTKSTNNHPLGSPKSFWKDNTTSAASSEEKKSSRRSSSGEKPSILSLLSPTMREMEISQDTSMDGSRSTTPLPLNYGKREQQKDVKKEQEHVNKRADYNNQNTPVHNKHHPGHGPMMRGQHQQQPPMHHMQASPWAQLGYMPSPVPGAFPSMSPGFGLYPQMEPNPNDRVRNLRGRGPPVHAIPPSHRLPPPTYHHFSPLTNVMKRPTRPMAYHPPHGNVPPQVDVSSSSKSNCVPMKPPIPSKFQGDMNKYKDVAVPDFNNLVNFPCHMNQKSAPAPDGTRNCVMCGHSCPCTTGGKQKGKNNNSHPLADNNQNKGASGMNNNFAIIPSQNKGLCTLCDVNVWIVVHSHLEIKWCKGCKNFRPWAAFGEKGLATKCVRCRERQREKYAMEKEKKERAKIKPSSGRVMASN